MSLHNTRGIWLVFSPRSLLYTSAVWSLGFLDANKTWCPPFHILLSRFRWWRTVSSQLFPDWESASKEERLRWLGRPPWPLTAITVLPSPENVGTTGYRRCRRKAVVPAILSHPWGNFVGFWLAVSVAGLWWEPSHLTCLTAWTWDFISILEEDTCLCSFSSLFPRDTQN